MRCLKRCDRQYRLELIDTGVFDGGRYFDVVAEYAKNSPDDILVQITVAVTGTEARVYDTHLDEVRRFTPFPGFTLYFDYASWRSIPTPGVAALALHRQEVRYAGHDVDAEAAPRLRQVAARYPRPARRPGPGARRPWPAGPRTPTATPG